MKSNLKTGLWLVVGIYICLAAFKLIPDKKEPKINHNQKLTYIFEVKKKHNIPIQDIGLTVQYMAVNRECNKTLFPSGVSVPLIRTFNLPVKGTSNITRVEVVDDLFEPGFCKWKLSSLAVSWDSPKYGRQSSDVGSLLPKPITNIPKKDYEYSCSLLASRLACYGAEKKGFNLNSNDFNIRRLK